MKKERIETLVDSFIDENGYTRHFVIAAISIVFDESNEPDVVLDSNAKQCQNVIKGLKLGFSICNPADEFDINLGIKIAIGRARKNSEYAILVSEPGFINTKLVQAFLEQEAEYFKHNPESRIAGYKRK